MRCSNGKNAITQTVQKCATSSGQETLIVLEKLSARQKQDERMKRLDIEFKI